MVRHIKLPEQLDRLVRQTAKEEKRTIHNMLHVLIAEAIKSRADKAVEEAIAAIG